MLNEAFYVYQSNRYKMVEGIDKKKQRIRTNGNDPQMKIRVPKDLKEMLEKFAEKNGRSKVAEILYRLRKSFL